MSACDNITCFFFFRPRFKCQPLSTLRLFSVNLLRVSLCQHYILLFEYTFSVLAFDSITFFSPYTFYLEHLSTSCGFCVQILCFSLCPHYVPLSVQRVFHGKPLSSLSSFYVPRFLCLCQHCAILYVHVLRVHFVRVMLFLCPASTFLHGSLSPY